MFGYDRDPGMMKVYIDEPLYKLFSDINATNNSIIAQVERGTENIKIYYPDGLNPTRGAVLDNKKSLRFLAGQITIRSTLTTTPLRTWTNSWLPLMRKSRLIK